MTGLLTPYRLAFVFAIVLVTQLGLPIPAVPAMIVAGALGVGGEFSAIASLALAVTAAVIADSIWYMAGRMYGDRMLAFLGRVSPQLKSRVLRTSAYFDRWGPLALALAKFIPVFSTIAPALAGSSGIRYIRFLLFDALGAACWAGTAIVVGMLLGAEIDKVGFLRPYSSVTPAGFMTGGHWGTPGARGDVPEPRTIYRPRLSIISGVGVSPARFPTAFSLQSRLRTVN